MTYVISVDAGTTNLKACLFELSASLRMTAEAEKKYDLFPVPDGGVEQDHEQWWQALSGAVRELLEKTGVAPEEILGLSVCAQMLGVVLVDREGVPVRRPMNYLDQRAQEEFRRGIGHGLRIAGCNVWKLMRNLAATNAAPTSVSDPLWKYKWVEAHEPERFAGVWKWLDVKDYLNLRLTGNAAATEDTAFVTMLYENAGGRKNFSARMLRQYGVQEAHLPRVIRSTDVVGGLAPAAAAELGLAAGTPVFGGGGDATCIAIGAGSAGNGETHVYMGTSGWVSTVSDKNPVDPIYMIASIPGAEENRFNFHAEMNAAGKCYEWVRDHVALDEIHILSEQNSSAGEIKVYERLSQAVQQAEVGSGGVMFAPWLAGERCPISTSQPCGMYFNLSLRANKADLIRAVLEGICYHITWMMEKHEKKLPASPTLRFVGGGAMSAVVCQILADTTGRQVETILWPQNAGAVGAAAIAAIGLGYIPDFASVRQYIPVDRVYEPDEKNHAVYTAYYEVFKKLYGTNKKLLGRLHDIGSMKV